MITNVEWLFIIVLALIGQKALTVRPRLDERLGMIGASVFFYMLLKAAVFLLFHLDVENGYHHVISGFVSFVPIQGLFIWLRMGTLMREAANDQRRGGERVQVPVDQGEG